MTDAELWPEKGERVRIAGCNEAGQRLAFEGVVLGVEFRTQPPVIRVRANDGRCHDVTNVGYGSRWEKR